MPMRGNIMAIGTIAAQDLRSKASSPRNNKTGE
jgi:hypothetical protein